MDFKVQKSAQNILFNAEVFQFEIVFDVLN
jgi:hypothetical protein